MCECARTRVCVCVSLSVCLSVCLYVPTGIVPSSIELAPTPSSDEPAFKEFDFAFLTANLLFPSTLSHERLRIHTEIRATVVYAAGSLYGPEEIVTARTVVRTWNDYDLEAMRPPTCLVSQGLGDEASHLSGVTGPW